VYSDVSRCRLYIRSRCFRTNQAPRVCWSCPLVVRVAAHGHGGSPCSWFAEAGRSLPCTFEGERAAVGCGTIPGARFSFETAMETPAPPCLPGRLSECLAPLPPLPPLLALLAPQLNIYGFHKTRHEEDSCEFKQPNFKRGQRHLLGLIRRKGHSSGGASATGGSYHEGSNYSSGNNNHVSLWFEVAVSTGNRGVKCTALRLDLKVGPSSKTRLELFCGG